MDKELVPVDTSAIDKQRDSNGRLLKGNTVGWVEGQSGNPNGRPPKDVCLTSLYKEEMLKLHGDTKLTREQIIAKKVATFLADEDIDAVYLRLLEIFQERTEGKVTLPIAGEIETILTVRYDR